MSIATRLSVLLLVFAVADSALADKVALTSPIQRAALLELYTSEGCSSCPPADRWLSGFKGDPRLWQQIVPVAFHVDYWNGLGWRDPFSSHRHTQRQYRYRQLGHVESAYTPGLVYNGREWRGWFRRRPLPGAEPDPIGVLKALIDPAAVSVEFMPAREVPSPLILNIALLAFDQVRDVEAGENSGRTLTHDFVVVDWRQFARTAADHRYLWSLEGLPAKFPDNATGIALWVTSAQDPTPLQATGGFLE